MPEKTIKSYGDDAKITLAYGGDRFTHPGELNLKASKRHWDHYFDGPALRDALIEAFPLRDKPAVAAGDEPAAEELVPEPKFLDVVPGCVIVGRDGSSGYARVCLPDGRYYNVQTRRIGRWVGGAPLASLYQVAFDPRTAKALPNPLGIRVGDRVRRTTEHCGVATTVEFEVSNIDAAGLIMPRYGRAYHPKGFEVVGREVPDRLPVGTIVRGTWKQGTDAPYLITGTTAISLTTGREDRSDFGGLVNRGYLEVVYLP